jgi:hypothetical protein
LDRWVVDYISLKEQLDPAICPACIIEREKIIRESEERSIRDEISILKSELHDLIKDNYKLSKLIELLEK